jgi:hypothetical protein
VVAEAVLEIGARDEAIVVLVEGLEDARVALPSIGAERTRGFVAEKHDTATEALIEIVLVDAAVAVAVEVIENGDARSTGTALRNILWLVEHATAAELLGET